MSCLQCRPNRRSQPSHVIIIPLFASIFNSFDLFYVLGAAGLLLLLRLAVDVHHLSWLLLGHHISDATKHWLLRFGIYHHVLLLLRGWHIHTLLLLFLLLWLLTCFTAVCGGPRVNLSVDACCLAIKRIVLHELLASLFIKGRFGERHNQQALDHLKYV